MVAFFVPLISELLASKNSDHFAMKISIILGTRPEIIKLSPIIRECEHLNLDYFVLHTGQHYSDDMNLTFFQQLKLPGPKHNLRVGSGSHAEQTGKMLIGIEKVLVDEKPDIVLVQGDTNTTLAGALAAAKLRIKIAHVEAGLRSYNQEMPEEINRVLVDHCSDLLFAPTRTAKRTLLREGIRERSIFVTGNTIVDAVNENLALSKTRSNTLKSLDITGGAYFVVTVHRQENVDNENIFRRIMEGLETVGEVFDKKLIYPVHPRAKRRLNEIRIKSTHLHLMEPLDYLTFLQVESCAELVLTDSGGVQEEACILGVPCVTLRNETERPETLEVGSNVLAGPDPKKIVECAGLMLHRHSNWKNPFGNGTAGMRTMEILRKEFA